MLRLGWLPLVLALLASCGCKTWGSATSLMPSLPKSLVESPSDPQDKRAEACIVTAQTLHQEGHYLEAAKLLEKAQAESPQRYDYARHLAVLYDELHMPEEAEQAFHAALAKHPNDADLRNDFGYFYFRQGNNTQAEQEFRAALAIAPTHQHAQTNLARTLFRQNRLEEAHRAFAKVVGPAAAHQNMGVLLAQEGRDVEARQAFQEALKANPNLENSREFLAGLDRVSLQTR